MDGPNDFQYVLLLCTNQCIHHQPTVLHCTARYCTVLYCTVLYFSVLYCSAEDSYRYTGESNLDLV
jgi:hypothetical protein